MATAMDSNWLLGTVVSINKEKKFGFIDPSELLPSPYRHKNVFFHMSVHKGPPVRENMEVEFQLKEIEPEKPAAKAVKQRGWIVKERNRSHSRSRSTPKMTLMEFESNNSPDDRRSRSRSRVRKHTAMSLMDVDSSSRETLNSDFGESSSGNDWQYGKVVKLNINGRHGFIKPSVGTDEENQVKDIYFHFSAQIGRVEEQSDVQYLMDPSSDPYEPAAKKVKKVGHMNKQKDKNFPSNDQDGMNSGNKRKQPNNQSDKLYENLQNVDKNATAPENKKALRGGKRRDFVSRITGNVVKILGGDSRTAFIKPLTEMPEGYPSDKDVHVILSNVENGGLHIKCGDKLEFSLGTQDKSKPFARSAKVVYFTPRHLDEIEEYLQQLKSILKAGTDDEDEEEKMSAKESEILCRVLACKAVWKCIGDTRDMSNETTLLIIDVLLLIHKRALGMQHAFVNILQTVCQTYLFDPWSGPLKNAIKHNTERDKSLNDLPSLKDFLLLIMDKVPEKSSAIVTLVKPLVSINKNSMEYFLFTMLKHSTQYCSANIDDLPWENLPLVPSAEELTTGPLENSSSLQPVKSKGPYESAEEYMDVYFRLLRADCFDSLRKGVRAFLDGKLDLRDMNVYHTITLVGIHLTNQDSGLAVALQVVPLKKVKNWATSSNLMFGNLLCLSLSNSFRDPIWATVVNRDVKLLESKGVVIVELCSENNTMNDSAVITMLSHGSGRIIAVESPTYYRAYQPVLKALQTMSPEELPFYEELVKSEFKREIPSYINENTSVDASILCNSSASNSAKEPLHAALERGYEKSGLDKSQFLALANAMIHRVGVIQGPPGTGKTFIGIKIVDLILSMSTAPSSPILVLTYKNHALDEFLKAIIQKYPHAVARVGGRCKEPDLEKCNLSELRKSQKKSQALGKLFSQKYSEADELRPAVKRCSSNLDRACSYNLETLLAFATGDQVLSMIEGCDWSMVTIHTQSPDANSKPRKLSVHEITSLISKSISKIEELQTDVSTFLSMPSQNEALQNNLKTFIEEARKQWYPGERIVKEVEEALGTYSAVDLESVVQTDNEDSPILDLHDEKDIEDMEKERMAAVSNKVIQNADIIEFHSSRKTKHEPCLFSTAKHVVQKIPIAKLMNCRNVWDLSPADRVLFIQCLLMKQIENPQQEFEKALSQYQQVCAAKNELDIQHSLSVVRNKKVIGMTITGASIHQNLLAALQPAIVLVEEAAEVLEPQLIAALGKSVQHLILIGDHKQLRPPVESYFLKKDFHFDISMMERLINNRAMFCTLQMQNRMRPEFAALLKDIYPDLRDNVARVMKNDAPSCIDKSMFFWHHTDMEKGGRSYWNEKEAERAVTLCLFLLQQGYEPRQITILGAYQGQTALLRQKIREAERKYANLFPMETEKEINGKQEVKPQRVEIHTIDLYQGDENDIVIVSLVRSNSNNVTGFLKLLNRRCVAQSRARCGLYFIGNRHTVCQVKHWKDMVDKMAQQACVGSQLKIVCPNHRDTTIIPVATAADIPLGSSFCKYPCADVMDCRMHKCPLLCQPKHSHAFCKVEVAFVFERCQHLGKKPCWQDQKSMSCKKPCGETMNCGKHLCPLKCDPEHHHAYCSVRVDYIYRKCGHPTTKHCSETEESLRPCEEKVKIQHPVCGHLVEKTCHLSDTNAKCKVRCNKQIACGHLCTNKCSETCIDVKACKDCKKIKEEEEKRRKKMEEEQIKKYKEEIEVKLKEIRDSQLIFTRFDLKPDGDTASEYLQVEDRVKRYVQPMHNWLPDITRIEKVYNSNLDAKFFDVQKHMFDPRRKENLFHGTSATAVDNIVKDGFLIPAKGGMFGRGVYFATDSSKSARVIYTKGSNMLLLCDVLLGKSMTVTSARTDMNYLKIRNDGYDSLFAKRGTEKQGGVMNDEYVVYDSRQAVVRYVIHYTCKDIQSGINFLNGNVKSLTKHVLKQTRTVGLTDPLEINYRLAESQFFRFASRVKNKTLTSVEYYENPTLISKFKAKEAEMKKKYPGADESEFILAFHGTKPENIDPIVNTNFSLAKLAANTGDKGYFGAGIYFSEFPDVSLAYGNKLLLCLLLPGKSYDVPGKIEGASLQTGYDSHRFQKDTQGRGQELVIFDPDQILPCYVLNIQ